MDVETKFPAYSVYIMTLPHLEIPYPKQLSETLSNCLRP